MRLHLQPADSRLCGQYCVAMLAAVDPEVAIAVFGSSGPAWPAAVTRVLAHFGFRASAQLSRIRQDRPLPALCLLKLSRPKQAAFHWVVFHAGTVYCPLLGIVNYEDYPQGYKGLRFTSLLEIAVASQYHVPAQLA